MNDRQDFEKDLLAQFAKIERRVSADVIRQQLLRARMRRLWLVTSLLYWVFIFADTALHWRYLEIRTLAELFSWAIVPPLLVALFYRLYRWALR